MSAHGVERTDPTGDHGDTLWVLCSMVPYSFREFSGTIKVTPCWWLAGKRCRALVLGLRVPRVPWAGRPAQCPAPALQTRPVPSRPARTIPAAAAARGAALSFDLLLCCSEEAAIQIKIRLLLQQQDRWFPITQLAKKTGNTCLGKLYRLHSLPNNTRKCLDG